MNLNNIAEQVTIVVVSTALLWLGSRLARIIWAQTAKFATRLKAMYQSNDPISARAQARLARMKEMALVLIFVTMLSLQVRATGPVLQAADVVMLCVWTWCLLTTLLHIARRK